jgi:hypothetical protein
VITPELHDALKDSILRGEKHPLVIEEGGKVYIPYDDIVVRAKPRPDRTWHHGHFILEFRNKGELIKTQHCGPVHFSAGDTLALTGVNWRIELDII